MNITHAAEITGQYRRLPSMAADLLDGCQGPARFVGMVEHHVRTFSRELQGNASPNAGACSGYQGAFAAQFLPGNLVVSAMLQTLSP
jgi:hypothetical protein